MRFTTLAANESVATLAQRLYRPTTPEAQRAAERALLEANPGLAEAASRGPGVVVIVPDVSGAPAAAAGAEATLLAPILGQARERLGEVRDAVRGALESRRAAVNATLEGIESAELRQLVRDEPAARDAIAEVSRTAKIEATEIDALDRLQAQAMDELGQDLDELLRMVGGEPPVIRGDTRPPVGDTRPPVGDTRPSVGDTRPPVGDTRPPVGDTRPPVGDTRPPVGDTRPPVGDTRPPVGDTQPPRGGTPAPPVRGDVPRPSTGGTTGAGPVRRRRKRGPTVSDD